MQKLISIITIIVCCLSISNTVYANSVSDNIITHTDFCLLSHIIAGEAGADYCKDELMYYVGSVVLNRVRHPDFPNTIEEVAFQPGQYQCVRSKKFHNEPSNRVKLITWDLLLHGSVLPEDVLYQSNFIQGTIHSKIQGVYFCFN